MRIKPGIGDQSKHPALDTCVHGSPKAEVAFKTKSRRRSRHHQSGPQKTSSTVATVTVFLDGEPAHDGANMSESHESEDNATWQQRKRHRRSPSEPLDLKARSLELANSGSDHSLKDHKAFPESCKSMKSALTVFDLENPSALPSEIVDLITCHRDGLCVHDHERCRVVDNKLYIYSKPNNCSAHPTIERPMSPLKISEFHESPTNHKMAKKVTFLPDNPQASIKRPSFHSVGSGADCHRPNITKWMPPPPKGYHVRVDASSPDSSSYIEEDDSTLNATDQEPREMGKQCANRKSDSNRRPKRVFNDKGALFKEIKSNFKKAYSSSPKNIVKSLKNQLKELGFESEDVVIDLKENSSKRNSRPRCEKKCKRSVDCYASKNCSDEPVFKGDDTMSVDHRETMHKIFRQVAPNGTSQVTSNQSLHEISPNKPFDVKTRNNYPRPAKDVKCNVGRLRHTLRKVRKGVNNNNTMTNTFHNCYLNTNANALVGGETDSCEKKDTDGVAVGSDPNQTSVTPGDVEVPVVEVVPTEAGVQDAEVASAQTLTCGVVEAKPAGIQIFIPEMMPAQGGDLVEKSPHPESEPSGWEAKKHHIVQACNQAIKSRLQRQETEDEESKDMTTTSESVPSRPSNESRKKRKTKTESVFVKFKASLSKKTTTTTTVKEVKPTSSGCNSKSLMLDSDHQSALGISSQSSDQSLAVPQPRYTRIVKCGETENPIRKRKLSSDTEVELLHLNNGTRNQSGVSKSGKDIACYRQFGLKENTFVDTSATEEKQSSIVDKRVMASSPARAVRRSYHNGSDTEVNDDFDKLSDKASAVTVINMKGSPHLTRKNERPSEDEDENNMEQENSKSSGSKACEEFCNKERSKRRSKSHSSRPSTSKKNIETKKRRSRSGSKFGTVETTANDCLEQPQSDISLPQAQKKTSQASVNSKGGRHSRRCHSSPPECRKKKSGSKKKPTVNLVEPTESASRRIHKGRKRSVDRKKKPKAHKSGRLRNSASTSSAGSDKKRKSLTTASSISSDSINDPSEVEETSFTKSPKSDKGKDHSEENYFRKIGSKSVSQKAYGNKLSSLGTVPDAAEDKHSNETKVSQSPPGVNEQFITEQTADIQAQKLDIPFITIRVPHKAQTKSNHARGFMKNQLGEKDLHRAEKGWNNSVYQTDTVKTRASVARKRSTFKRTKVKYFIVKAKDKHPENNVKKHIEVKKPCKELSEQGLKSEESKESSQKVLGKTVQFSESIEKMENLKIDDVIEEVAESLDEHVIDGHPGDNGSDGSVGNHFISENFDLVKEMVVDGDEIKLSHHQLDQETKANALETSGSPKRHRRPVWLKKASVKPTEEIQTLPASSASVKPNLSPPGLDKKKDSFEQVFNAKKCNIEVTYPLPPAGVSPKVEQGCVKTKVAYSEMLRNIILALPLKKPVKRFVAQMGTPVDIKEVTEGSSVDAADYAKALKYSSTAKRPVAVAAASTSANNKRKKGVAESRLACGLCRPSKPGLLESSSIRSIESAESEPVVRRVLTPNCSFSTDVDEAAVGKQRNAHSAPGCRAARPMLRKKGKRTSADAAMMQVGPGWPLMGGVPSDLQQDSPMMVQPVQDRVDFHHNIMHVAGDMNVFNAGLSWILQQLFNRFSFLNSRRPCRPVYRPLHEHTTDLVNSDIDA